jgi:predicted flap endonuclease-1-like 5' DNA nuclease
MASISNIEGIGPAATEKLNAAGVKTAEGLLKKAATKAGRKSLAQETGIDEKKILKFVNMADLFRVKGVGEEISELLEAAGVDTIKELGTRVPANLHKKMVEINEQKKLVRQVPSESQVENFIAHAKELDPMVTH